MNYISQFHHQREPIMDLPLPSLPPYIVTLAHASSQHQAVQTELSENKTVAGSATEWYNCVSVCVCLWECVCD